MSSKQVGELVRVEDAALRATASTLERLVPDGRWVLAVTADHGMTPFPKESGGWAIRGGEIQRDLEREFGRGTVRIVTSAGVFLERPGHRAREMGEWLADYTAGDNVMAGEEVPLKWRGREDELLFDAVMAARKVVGRNCGAAD
jgi:hypothetical protein